MIIFVFQNLSENKIGVNSIRIHFMIFNFDVFLWLTFVDFQVWFVDFKVKSEFLIVAKEPFKKSVFRFIFRRWKELAYGSESLPSSRIKASIVGAKWRAQDEKWAI